MQELHNLEVNLVETQREQRLQEKRLQQREAELAERELTLLQRELHVMMAQQQPSQAIPTPKKRKGKFKKNKLKKESSSSSMISGPSGLFYCSSITDAKLTRQQTEPTCKDFAFADILILLQIFVITFA